MGHYRKTVPFALLKALRTVVPESWISNWNRHAWPASRWRSPRLNTSDCARSELEVA
jgi:hypothetical protein